MEWTITRTTKIRKDVVREVTKPEVSMSNDDQAFSLGKEFKRRFRPEM